MPGGHLRLDFANERRDGRRSRRSVTVREPVTGSVAVDVAGDGSVRQVRQVLDRLDVAGVESRSWRPTPDLDDVFLALTGRATTHDDAASDDAQELETVR